MEIIEEVLSLVADDEKEREQMWFVQNKSLETPLWGAAKLSLYNVLDWRLSQMTELQKNEFFDSKNDCGYGPLTNLTHWGNTSSSSKRTLRSVNVLVSHMTSKQEKHTVMSHALTICFHLKIIVISHVCMQFPDIWFVSLPSIKLTIIKINISIMFEPQVIRREE